MNGEWGTFRVVKKRYNGIKQDTTTCTRHELVEHSSTTRTHTQKHTNTSAQHKHTNNSHCAGKTAAATTTLKTAAVPMTSFIVLLAVAHLFTCCACCAYDQESTQQDTEARMRAVSSSHSTPLHDPPFSPSNDVPVASCARHLRGLRNLRCRYRSEGAALPTDGLPTGTRCNDLITAMLLN